MNCTKLLHWYKETSRPLPWRETHDPYKIWVSEIFLQQTQALRVMAFYTRMIERYPTVQDLAKSNWEEFFPYFKGLGFYGRGKNMLKCAEIIVREHNGIFPNDAKTLQTLPGIGDYTAHAICSFAYKQSLPALDVNLFRVMGRFWDLETDTKKIREKAFHLYKTSRGDMLNHAFMDLGASLCTAKKVQCEICPLKEDCQFFKQGKEIIIPEKKKKKVRKADEFSVLVLRDEKKYLLQKKTDGTWGFPIFARDTKKNKDHRHFLQSRSQEKWGIEISVRPPFFTEEIENKEFSKNIARLRFSRCQILSGTLKESENLAFFSLKEIEKRTLETVYSQEFLKKWKKMKI